MRCFQRSAIIMKKHLLLYFLLFFSARGFSQNTSDNSESAGSLPDLYFNSWIRMDKFIAQNPRDSLPHIKPMDYLRYLATYQFDSDYDLLVRSKKESKQTPAFVQWKYTFSNFWITRNDAMVGHIIAWARSSPGKTVLVLCGFEHRYYLRNALDGRARSEGIAVREYWTRHP